MNHRVTIKNIHVNNHGELDTDFVIDCSGRPSDLSGYNVRNEIPVNAVSVTQCYWDGARFTQTLTIARPYGWVFGIPLLNRCSIGYLYNKDINTLEEVQEDVKNIFEEFRLEPSQDGNKFAFGNYTKKQNFTDRVAYNGNASFFLEPLEATSMAVMTRINHWALRVFLGQITPEQANQKYNDELDQVSNMIMLHYFAGSSFETPFWTEAQNRANTYLSNARSNQQFVSMIQACNLPETKQKFVFDNINEIGTWGGRSFLMNLESLGIKESLYDFLISKN